MSELVNLETQNQKMGSAEPDSDYYAAVIQSHWKGYSLRKSLRDLQLGDAQLQHHVVAQQQGGLHDNQGHEEQTYMQQQQLPHKPVSNGCRHGLTVGVQPDVWNNAAGTLIRNRGALQAKLAIRCGCMFTQ